MNVAVVGQVSAGKSSFINSLFGDFKTEVGRSRTTLEHTIYDSKGSLFSGFDCHIWDFPGVNDGEDVDGKYTNFMLDNLEKCDVVLYITNAETCFIHESEHVVFQSILDRIRDNNNAGKGPYNILVIANKTDVDDSELAKMRQKVADKYLVEIIPYSSHATFMQQRANMGIKTHNKKWSDEYRRIKHNAGVDCKEFSKSTRRLQKWVNEKLGSMKSRKHDIYLQSLEYQIHNLSRKLNISDFITFTEFVELYKKLIREKPDYKKHVDSVEGEVVNYLMGYSSQRDISFVARQTLYINKCIDSSKLWLTLEELATNRDDKSLESAYIMRLYNSITGMSSELKTCLTIQKYKFENLEKIFGRDVYFNVMHINSKVNYYTPINWDVYISLANRIINFTQKCLEMAESPLMIS